MTHHFLDKGFPFRVNPLSTDSYSQLLLGKDVPIVIDNGSYELRAGWALDSEPRLRCRNAVARMRIRNKGNDGPFVGDQIEEWEGPRMTVRTPFQQNVVANLENMECCLDYAFVNLGLSQQDRINHPIVLTEAPGNPNYCRSQLTELLFECYRAPSVCYALADLLALHYNTAMGHTGMGADGSALIVSSGYETTHVIPVFEGQARLSQGRRIGVGALQSQELLKTTLELHHPLHKTQLTSARAEELTHRFCTMSSDYEQGLEQVKLFDVNSTATGTTSSSPSASSADSLKPVVIQLPFVPPPVVETASAVDEAKKQERKQENARRMREAAAKKREQTIAQLKVDVAAFETLKNKKESGEISQAKFMSELSSGGFKDERDFLHDLKALKQKLARATNEPMEDDSLSKPDSEVYPLLDVPDDQLTADQIKEKRRQKLMKASADYRLKKKQEKEAKLAQQISDREAEEKRRLQDPQGYIQDMHQKRKEVLARRARRQTLSGTSTASSSSSAACVSSGLAAGGSGGSVVTAMPDKGARRLAAKKRMQYLAALGDDAADAQFGDDDDQSWQLYRVTSTRQPGDVDSASEEEREKLAYYEKQLELYDPESLKTATTGAAASSSSASSTSSAAASGGGGGGAAPAAALTERDFQLNLFVDRIRAPEVLYQPSIIGIQQAGLSEVISRVLASFNPTQAAQLSKCVFVTGGNTLYPNFDQRLKAELTALRPIESDIKIVRASNSLLDAWKGARLLAARSDFNSSFCFTRDDYLEKGTEYFKDHPFGNTYFPSMAAAPSASMEDEADGGPSAAAAAALSTAGAAGGDGAPKRRGRPPSTRGRKAATAAAGRGKSDS